MISFMRYLNKIRNHTYLRYGILTFVIILSFIIYLPSRDFFASLRLNSTKVKEETIGSNQKPISYQLIIPSLSIDVSIVPEVPGTDEQKYLEALRGGVAHYAGTALPGAIGNAFIFGHSSYTESQAYSEIFKNLNQLTTNDQIYIHKQDIVLKYRVIESKIVAADDLAILAQGNDEKLTLMTCWPIGTAKERMVVIATREGESKVLTQVNARLR